MSLTLQRLRCAVLFAVLTTTSIGFGTALAADSINLHFNVLQLPSTGSDAQYFLSAVWKDPSRGSEGSPFDRPGIVSGGKVTLEDLKVEKVYFLRAFARSDGAPTKMLFRASGISQHGLSEPFELRLESDVSPELKRDYVDEVKIQFKGTMLTVDASSPFQ